LTKRRAVLAIQSVQKRLYLCGEITHFRRSLTKIDKEIRELIGKMSRENLSFAKTRMFAEDRNFGEGQPVR